MPQGRDGRKTGRCLVVFSRALTPPLQFQFWSTASNPYSLRRRGRQVCPHGSTGPRSTRAPRYCPRRPLRFLPCLGHCLGAFHLHAPAPTPSLFRVDNSGSHGYLHIPATSFRASIGCHCPLDRGLPPHAPPAKLEQPADRGSNPEGAPPQPGRPRLGTPGEGACVTIAWGKGAPAGVLPQRLLEELLGPPGAPASGPGWHPAATAALLHTNNPSFVARMLHYPLPGLLHFCPCLAIHSTFPCPSGLRPRLHQYDLTSQFKGLLPGSFLESSFRHVSCSYRECGLERRPLPEKGKPAARRGRKAADQAMGLTARLPKEGRHKTPRERGGLPQWRESPCSGKLPLLRVTPSFTGLPGSISSKRYLITYILAMTISDQRPAAPAKTSGLAEPRGRGQMALLVATALCSTHARWGPQGHLLILGVRWSLPYFSYFRTQEVMPCLSSLVYGLISLDYSRYSN